MPERTLLLTGFGPFDGVADNPTARIAAALDGMPLAGWRVVGELLPVAWPRAGAQVAARVAALDPACIVHLGVAVQAQRVRIEAKAWNHLQFRVADADGAQPLTGQVVPGAPELLTPAIDAAALVAHLQRLGVDVELSDDAGRFVCNATYFSTLQGFADRRALFIHVPLAGDLWPIPRLTLAVAHALRWLVA